MNTVLVVPFMRCHFDDERVLCITELPRNFVHFDQRGQKAAPFCMVMTVTWTLR